jgi:hypothetical protein
MGPRRDVNAAQAKALADLHRQGQASLPSMTPRKRPVAQMVESPDVAPIATPTPSRPRSMASVSRSVASASRPRAVRPLRSPPVEDTANDSDGIHEGHPLFGLGGFKDERTALGWKFAVRTVVPEGVAPLRAGPRYCCLKCSTTYFNFPDQRCWAPAGMDRCADCLQGNHSCVDVRPLLPGSGACTDTQ